MILFRLVPFLYILNEMVEDLLCFRNRD